MLNFYEARWCQVQNVRMPWNLGVSLCKLGGHPKGLSLTAASTVAGLGARGRPVAGRRSVGRCPRGARHQARQTRHKLVFGRSCWNLNHDAVIRIGGKAPGGGPILSVGMSATSCCGSTPPRIVSQQFGLKPAASAEGNKMFLSSLRKGLSACRAQDDALQ